MLEQQSPANDPLGHGRVEEGEGFVARVTMGAARRLAAQLALGGLDVHEPSIDRQLKVIYPDELIAPYRRWTGPPYGFSSTRMVAEADSSMSSIRRPTNGSVTNDG